MSLSMWLRVGCAIALLGGRVTAQAPPIAYDSGMALEADYVVVGGGTAGCALAARICVGLPNSTVVLLERSLPRTDEQARFFRYKQSTSLRKHSSVVCRSCLLQSIHGARQK
jgi:hypothetical protein